MRSAATLAIILAGMAPGHGDEFSDSANAILGEWYAALSVADEVRLGDLLADEARIELVDLGVTQTRAEFLAGMEEWSDAIAGGRILWRVVQVDGTSVEAMACYDFASNDARVAERFHLANGRIILSTQQQVGDDCDAW